LPPGRGAAGRCGSCADRPRPHPAAPTAAASPAKPPPSTTTRAAAEAPVLTQSAASNDSTSALPTGPWCHELILLPRYSLLSVRCRSSPVFRITRAFLATTRYTTSGWLEKPGVEGGV
jgi:hypothetical protein